MSLPPPLLSLAIRLEPDVVVARQRARQIAGLLGFAPLDQTRIATAVSEIARNAFQYAGGGRVEFLVRPEPDPAFLIRVRERGRGIKDLQAILEGSYESPTGMGRGILGAKRLMDRFEVETSESGSSVLMTKALPRRSAPVSPADLARISAELATHVPAGLAEELQVQNEELLRALQEVRSRQAEVAELHRKELEDTNRGVVALYSELDENAIELKRISDLKSRFLSNMSHEFRSPLNTILSMTGFLLDGSSGALTPEQRKEIGFIRKAADGLSALVNDLLDLAKVEAGKAVIRAEDFEAADLFEGLRGTIQPLIDRGAVTLVIEPPEGVPPLHTDAGKVAQILRNFLSNAAKFTDRGEIRLAARPGPAETVIFSVTDTGIGIASEDLYRVFEEFGQVEGPAQRRFKGTGLGLPLSRKLAELLGGEVSVRSFPGSGSTFFAVIPRDYRDAEGGPAGPESRWRVDPGRSPVLVVEDDPVDLMLYEKFLEGSGFQVLPARTLSEARRALRRFRPVAVLLDILLDAESGWTLLAEMKGDAATRDVPIFVLTVVDGREKALSLGATDFGLKPIDRGWLMGRLAALERRGPLRAILMVDDEPESRYRLGRLIAAHGQFTIVEAASGEEGLRLAREAAPDVVFLDLFLGDMTGFQVLERMRRDDILKSIPVIINTSSDLGAEERRQLADGTTAILSKSAGSADEAYAAVRDALILAGIHPAPSGSES